MQEFKSFQANPEKLGKSEHRAALESYSTERDDFIIAGNAFLTLLRAQAFKLDFKNEQAGHKILSHNANVIKKLKLHIANESIVALDDWHQLGQATLSGLVWIENENELK